MLSLANLKMQFRILNKRSRGGEFLRRVFAISTKILIFAVPKTFKVLPFHKLLSGPLWPDAKIGDNIVQGYGQKICLKFTILDFPGRNLQQTA